MRNLLYLFNNGYRAFPHIGRGGLGYKPPIKIIGTSLHKIKGDVYYYDDEDPFTMYDEDGRKIDYSPESLSYGIGSMLYNNEPIRELKEYPQKDPEKDVELDVFEPGDSYYKREEDALNLFREKEAEEEAIIQDISEYVKIWGDSDSKTKGDLTRALNNKYDFTDDQKKQIDKIKKLKIPLEQKKEMLSEYLKNEKIDIAEAEAEDEIEGFEPVKSTFVPMSTEVIEGIKDTYMTFDDINDYVSDKYINMLNDFEGIKNNPFESLYEGYEDLIKTYDVKDVENLLYDNTGTFKPGLDFEKKVLDNKELVKEILISTYGVDNIDITNLKYNYDAKEDLFTVFDAHAVSFKLKNSKGNFEDKEAFIEFKKYSNYTKSISDLDNIIGSEALRFNDYIYNVIDNIQKINENLETAIIYNNKKDIKKYKKELKEYLSENNLNDLEKLKTKFYKELDPLGIGIKYTKFPQLEQNIIRPADSVNPEGGYKYLLEYEANPKRRKAKNILTHKKAKDENIDILVCTGLKNAMVTTNLSEIFRKHPGQNHIDYLHLKETVYSTKQKGSQKVDYDHFNVPITYFKNVNLSKFLNKKKKEITV